MDMDKLRALDAIAKAIIFMEGDLLKHQTKVDGIREKLAFIKNWLKKQAGNANFFGGNTRDTLAEEADPLRSLELHQQTQVEEDVKIDLIDIGSVHFSNGQAEEDQEELNHHQQESQEAQGQSIEIPSSSLKLKPIEIKVENPYYVSQEFQVPAKSPIVLADSPADETEKEDVILLKTTNVDPLDLPQQAQRKVDVTIDIGSIHFSNYRAEKGQELNHHQQSQEVQSIEIPCCSSSLKPIAIQVENPYSSNKFQAPAKSSPILLAESSADDTEEEEQQQEEEEEEEDVILLETTAVRKSKRCANVHGRGGRKRKREFEVESQRIKKELLADDEQEIQEPPKKLKKAKNIPRPFICHVPDCNKGFKDKAGLTSHLNVHKDPDVPCEYCPKLLKSKLALNGHMRNKHRTEMTHLEHKCNHEGCGQYFSTIKTLETHIKRTHAGTKCSKCPKIFYKSDKLRAHLRSFHLVCPNVSCDGRQFVTKEALEKHQKKFH